MLIMLHVIPYVPYCVIDDVISRFMMNLPDRHHLDVIEWYYVFYVTTVIYYCY